MRRICFKYGTTRTLNQLNYVRRDKDVFRMLLYLKYPEMETFGAQICKNLVQITKHDKVYVLYDPAHTFLYGMTQKLT